ncbi:MAG TPA: right-handed parallel beta-helix repeat-containing protein, partial [Kofleriaceae bacterium]|nr:right-handed parallel beta-helix repeat-containing protein [Kofleriaceae bacterium]
IAHDHIADNTQQGLWLQGASSTTIVANELVGNGGAAGAFDNVLLSDDANANVFDGNIVRSGSRYGVSIATPDCDGNAITNNDLVGAGAMGALLDLGTGTVVDGNLQ